MHHAPYPPGEGGLGQGASVPRATRARYGFTDYPFVKKSDNRIKKRHQTAKRLAKADLKLAKADFQTGTCQ
jgi:hypothetical protein